MKRAHPYPVSDDSKRQLHVPRTLDRSPNTHSQHRHAPSRRIVRGRAQRYRSDMRVLLLLARRLDLGGIV